MNAVPQRDAGSPAQVLIVEDNAINQGTMLRMLALGGIQADLVSDGHQAVERCRHQQYALVLMDVQMPVMDGLEAARLIRAGAKPAPVIIGVSAHAFAADRRAATSAGMSEYLAKPVRLEALLGTLRKNICPIPLHPERFGSSRGFRRRTRPQTDPAQTGDHLASPPARFAATPNDVTLYRSRQPPQPASHLQLAFEARRHAVAAPFCCTAPVRIRFFQL